MLRSCNNTMDLNKIGDLPYTIKLCDHTEQMDKAQDQTYTGVAVDELTGESFIYGMITDGHGSNECIEFLRSFSRKRMAEIIGKRNPVETLAEYIISKTKKGGATMCLTKVYKDRIECINCGDSRLAVYKDGELVFLSQEHNWTNSQERQRLIGSDNFMGFTPSSGIQVTNETDMIGCYMEYATWKDHSKLACTQSLGSNGKTGYAPDHTVIPIEPLSTYKIIIGSDGLWDMMIKNKGTDLGVDNTDLLRLYTMSARNIVDMAVSRWLQEWNMGILHEGTISFEKGQYKRYHCDDVSSVVIDILPL